jgi:hypothetical protein
MAPFVPDGHGPGQEKTSVGQGIFRDFRRIQAVTCRFIRENTDKPEQFLGWRRQL